ncbi:MAG: alkaline phosphatase family protein [bacterium]
MNPLYKPWFLILLLLAGGMNTPAAEPDRMAVLISVDGLASYYLEDPLAGLPTLQRLAREGASASRMEVCFPSVTWTSHTTLVTGTYPRKHGLISNTVLDRKTLKPIRYVGDPVFTKDEAVKAQTLYDAAHEAGLKTAAVIWPAVRGAKTLDWLTPDVNSEELILRETTPEINRDLGAPFGNPVATFAKWRWGVEPGPMRDWKYSELAAYLLTQKRPNLLLLHLVCPDAYNHEYGPQSPEAYWSINYIDSRLNYLVEQVRQAGLIDRTAFFVVSDHGFESVTHHILPNVALRKAGLAKFEDSGLMPGGGAYALSNGGSAAVYILDTKNKEEVTRRVREVLARTEGIQQILGPEDYHQLGLPTPEENPEQGDLMLIPQEHYAFSDTFSGEDVVKKDAAVSGTHGYLPTHPRMGAVFVAWGNGIRPGVELGTIQSVDVAPTAARYLGITMKKTDGRVIGEILEEK